MKSRFGRTSKPPGQMVQRHLEFEELLCKAIKGRVLVMLSYGAEPVFRNFQPSVVYFSTTGKVCVSGVEVTNPVRSQDNLEPQIFEVGLISQMSITALPFAITAPADRSDEQYAKGIICA